MLLLTFLLVPIVSADVYDRTINNYVIKLDGSTLKGVQPTGTSSSTLNLSGLGLQVLEKDVFNNLITLKNLNLENNSLAFIPKRLFSKLGNLEHLSLANNNISNFKKSFEGLDNLKTLNISNNPLTKFEATDLSGLPKSSIVFTKGLSISTINAFAFEKKPGRPYGYDSDEEYNDYEDNEEEEEEEDVENNRKPKNKLQEKNVNASKRESRSRGKVKKYYGIKICRHDDVLKVVEPFKKNETLPSGCQWADMGADSDYLSLENLGIAKFEKGWYRLNEITPILRINFSGNKIVQVTRELLNDLPSSVLRIDLSRNKIERLDRGIIQHSYIWELVLDSNNISEIEENALVDMLGLKELSLNDNLLTGAKFAATLPRTINVILLSRNRITEITPGSFSGLAGLLFLHLNGNLIQEVKSDSLQGLFGLVQIGLSSNRITKIQPGSFDRTDLHSVDLSNNNISSFEKGVFDNRSRVALLNVGQNKLSNIKKDFPDGLPPNLRKLELDFNEIEKLERDTFKNVPTEYLSLRGNKISQIERGSFHLRRLEKMILDKNALSELDIELFNSLERLEELSLRDNGITSIPKGFTKNMPKLEKLDLSNNPIKRLQNGALYGFRKTARNVLHLNKVPVDVIEAGLFDDM